MNSISFAKLFWINYHTVYIPLRLPSVKISKPLFFNRQWLLHNDLETQLKKELAIMMRFHRHSGQMLRPDFLFPNDSGG